MCYVLLLDPFKNIFLEIESLSVLRLSDLFSLDVAWCRFFVWKYSHFNSLQYCNGQLTIFDELWMNKLVIRTSYYLPNIYAILLPEFLFQITLFISILLPFFLLQKMPRRLMALPRLVGRMPRWVFHSCSFSPMFSYTIAQ